MATITAPSGDSRILLRLPDLTFLAGADVLSAKVLFAVPRPERITTFDLRPLATAWEPGTVTWASPWGTEGGDLAGSRASRSTLFPSSHSDGTVVIDATAIFQAFAAGEVENIGLLLKPLADEGTGYPAAIASALASPAAFQIEIRHDEAE